MKGLCQKCHSSGVEVTLTEISRNELGKTEIPLCEKAELYENPANKTNPSRTKMLFIDFSLIMNLLNLLTIDLVLSKH